MAYAYQLVVNGRGDTVAATFARALEHVGEAMRARSVEPRPWIRDDEYTELLAADAGGTELQRIRHESRNRWEDLRIVRHDLDARPGFVTGTLDFDLHAFSDPAYAVQSALWDFADTGRTYENALENLDQLYREALRADPRPGEDVAARLERLRLTEAEMGGARLIPATGDPSAILASLPDIVTARFAEAVARAYPDDVPPEAGPSTVPGPR